MSCWPHRPYHLYNISAIGGTVNMYFNNTTATAAGHRHRSWPPPPQLATATTAGHRHHSWPPPPQLAAAGHRHRSWPPPPQLAAAGHRHHSWPQLATATAAGHRHRKRQTERQRHRQYWPPMSIDTWFMEQSHKIGWHIACKCIIYKYLRRFRSG